MACIITAPREGITRARAFSGRALLAVLLASAAAPAAAHAVQSKPTLSLQSARSQVAGLGVQSAHLTVGVRGGALDGPVTVTLSSDRGVVEPAQVVLTGRGVVPVRLRSAGIGAATITAFAPGLGSAATSVEFALPLLFLMCAMLGGCVGGIGAALHGRNHHTSTEMGRQHVLLGTVAGLFAAVVYFAIGVNLVGAEVHMNYFNEAAVFAVAAGAGLLGLPMLRVLNRDLARTPS